jgi:hypothetical protein
MLFNDITIGLFEEVSIPPDQSFSAPLTVYAHKKAFLNGML